MASIDSGSGSSAPRKRADARRNEKALLDAAAAVFVVSGVEAPVRHIAAAAGVGIGTIYRHFPTEQTSSSPSTATRSTPAPKPDQPCWRVAAHRTLRYGMDRSLR